jgi:hypothetical protein
MIGNYIHDTGPTDKTVDQPGAGSHFPGGLYNDEGTTNCECCHTFVCNLVCISR